MKSRLIISAAIGMLITAPAFATPVDSRSIEDDKKAAGAGLLVGGVLGAIVGGPPGLVAGMMIGGYTIDHELTARRADLLADRNAGLEREHLARLANEKNMKARAEELGRQLDYERRRAASAADIAMLADGLELAVGFRTNSAEPPVEMVEGLNAVAMLVASVPSLEIHLDGYADPRGGEAYNRDLSLARAEAIRDQLVAAGVASKRIHVTAHGAALIADPEAIADPDGWALQRRVNIRLESEDGRLASKH